MAIREIFLREIWGRGVLWCGTSKQSAKSFLHENHIFHQFAKVFSLQSFPLCGMVVRAWKRSQTSHMKIVQFIKQPLNTNGYTLLQFITGETFPVPLEVSFLVKRCSCRGYKLHTKSFSHIHAKKFVLLCTPLSSVSTQYL